MYEANINIGDEYCFFLKNCKVFSDVTLKEVVDTQCASRVWIRDDSLLRMVRLNSSVNRCLFFL